MKRDGPWGRGEGFRPASGDAAGCERKRPDVVHAEGSAPEARCPRYKYQDARHALMHSSNPRYGTPAHGRRAVCAPPCDLLSPSNPRHPLSGTSHHIPPARPLEQAQEKAARSIGGFFGGGECGPRLGGGRLLQLPAHCRALRDAGDSRKTMFLSYSLH